jgi:hypothetical protein
MSSLFNQASLVVEPAVYENGKVYATKPFDGTGDLTFTRATNATRVASNGLIEKVRENLALYSEDATDATYVKTNATVTGNTIAAPDGTLTADTITATSANGQVQGIVTITSGLVHTVSVWLKRKTGTGTVQLRGVSNTSTTVTITNDWARYSVSLTASDTNGRYGVLLQTSGDEVYCWGFQLEASDVMTDYIATTTTAVSVGPVSGLPRLDYLNSTCPRLLLEPQRTNLATFSEQFNNAAWGAISSSITANSAISPDGYQNADNMPISSGLGNGLQRIFNISSSTQYYFSIYAKSNGATSFKLRLFDGSTGASNTETKTPTNEWQRFDITRTSGASTPQIRLDLFDNDGDLLIYGGQFEAGAYATSYIPNLNTPLGVTRVADAASKTGISSLIGQTEGTVFVEVNYTNTGTDQTFISTSDGTLNNRITIGYSLSLNVLNAFVRVGGITQALMTSATSPANGIKKIAVSYKLNDYSLYINGTEVALDSSALVPTCSRIDVGSLLATGNEYPVNQALLFKTRLTPAQLAELTA